MGIIVKTTFAGVEIDASGALFVKVRKEVWNSGVLIQSEPHRSPIDALADIDEALDATDAHLVAMGFEPMAPSARSLVKALRDVAHADSEVKSEIEVIRAKRAEEAEKAEEAAKANLAFEPSQSPAQHKKQ